MSKIETYHDLCELLQLEKEQPEKFKIVFFQALQKIKQLSSESVQDILDDVSEIKDPETNIKKIKPIVKKATKWYTIFSGPTWTGIAYTPIMKKVDKILDPVYQWPYYEDTCSPKELLQI